MNRRQTRVLVTGATGFLGSRLVEVLIEKGYWVRGLARKTSSTAKILAAGAEIMYGDVADLDSLRAPFEGIGVVVHAAADTAGTEDGTRRTTIQGTRNVLDLCEEFKIGKLVHISSCSVYGVADFPEGAVVTEDSSLERYPEKRGFYSLGKLEAEKLVIERMKKGGFPIVCLRPGTIFGPGGEVFTPMMGFSMGEKLFVVIGMGGFVLPLVYIDNLVDAIMSAIRKKEGDGKIFNVVDPEPLDKKAYVNRLLKKLYPKAIFINIPYSLLYMTVFFQEYLFKLLGRVPFLTRYRLMSSQKSIRYDSSRIMRDLDWQPPYSMDDAIEAVVAYERKRRAFRQD